MINNFSYLIDANITNSRNKEFDMASAKKKQDEKNLKILRELVSQVGNKECFDCQQRGPTYVNMTIGSFVCTSCSGMLRGLTPPHRVKSISMASFTQEDIDFLKERGNEFCRAIWLGLMPQSTIYNSKDEQKIKDFMCAKYELKRYYLDPVMANQLLNQKSENYAKMQENTKNSSIKILPAKSIKSVPFSIMKANETKLVNSNTINFVADFSKVPAPSPFSISKINFHQPILPQPSFANFDNNPIFNSPKAVVSNINGINTPPSEDRYAALKDLDSLMKQVNLQNNPISSKPPLNFKDTNNAENPSWCTFDETNSHLISNPFAEDMWQPPVNILNNNHNTNINFQQMESNCLNTANPFRSTQLSLFNNDFHRFGQNSQNLDNVPSSLLSTLSNKSWQPVASRFRVNPFAVGSAIGDTMQNSNNPFL